MAWRVDRDEYRPKTNHQTHGFRKLKSFPIQEKVYLDGDLLTTQLEHSGNNMLQLLVHEKMENGLPTEMVRSKESSMTIYG